MIPVVLLQLFGVPFKAQREVGGDHLMPIRRSVLFQIANGIVERQVLGYCLFVELVLTGLWLFEEDFGSQ